MFTEPMPMLVAQILHELEQEKQKAKEANKDAKR